MTNHSNRKRTYWYSSLRGFANEYEVGIANTADAAQHYAGFGYERITKKRALRELCYRGNAATQVYCAVSIDGEQAYEDRFEIARDLR